VGVPIDFTGAFEAGLACSVDRRTEDDPSRIWAPATEQTRTPASAAAKRWDFEIIPLFLIIQMRLRLWRLQYFVRTLWIARPSPPRYRPCGLSY
jgi:hypothetical protein